MDIVTLATYSEIVQAELTKVFLESEGIECFIADANSSSLQMYGGASIGIRVQVNAEDQDRARELLDQFAKDKRYEIDDDALMAAFEEDAAERDAPISELPDSETSIENGSYSPEIAILPTEEEPTCPKCGSPRLAKEREFTFGLSLLTFLLLGLPLLFIKPKLKCKRCGYDLG